MFCSTVRSIRLRVHARQVEGDHERVAAPVGVHGNRPRRPRARHDLLGQAVKLAAERIELHQHRSGLQMAAGGSLCAPFGSGPAPGLVAEPPSGGRPSPSPFTPRPWTGARSGKEEGCRGWPVRTITDDPLGYTWVGAPRFGGLVSGRLRGHLIGWGWRTAPTPLGSGGRNRPLSPHPKASPPCGHGARAGAGRPAAWSTIVHAPSRRRPSGSARSGCRPERPPQ